MLPMIENVGGAGNSGSSRKLRQNTSRSRAMGPLGTDMEVRVLGAGHTGNSPLRSKPPASQYKGSIHEEESTSGIDFSQY